MRIRLPASALPVLSVRRGRTPRSPAEFARKVQRTLAARARTASFVRRVEIVERAGIIPIGDLGYGGYQLPHDLLTPDSVVVSAGAGTDVSFESMLVDRFGCHVHLLDPVPAARDHVTAALAHEHRISFENAALWSEDTELEFHAPEVAGHVSHSATNLHGTSPVFTARARSLASLRIEHGWDSVDLLKISAEGAEFAILDAVLAEREPVATICVEFAQPADMRRVDRAVEQLHEAGYVAVARTARPFNWKLTFCRRDWT